MTTSSEWVERLGPVWAEGADVIDRFFGPVTEAAVARFAPEAGWRVIDVGCGAGASTRALARAVGPEGCAVGVDISPDLVAAARARDDGAGGDYVVADAAAHDFGDARFDGVFSRFGSMFFDRPVPAFAHIRAAMRPGGRAFLLAWRPLAENPWVAAPARAIRDLVDPAALPADGGGPFTWPAPGVFRPILEDAGWRDVRWEAFDARAPYGAGPSADPLDRAVAQTLRINPVSRAVATLDDRRRAEAKARIREAFAPWLADGEVRVTTAVWFIEARA